MLTINTNPGAMIALQNLNQTNRDLMHVQGRVNTGLKVASARDNGGVYAIAQGMRSQVGGLRAVQQSLDLAISVTDVALAAGEAISDLLIEMKEKALAASDTSLDTASRSALNEDFTKLYAQFVSILLNAEFNGINLIYDPQNLGMSAMANADGSNRISVSDVDMSLGGFYVSYEPDDIFLSSAKDGADAVAELEDIIREYINPALGRLSAFSKALDVHKTFVSKLSDTLQKGIGNLVDADMARESARLQALQVKQQLGLQALSIANSAPGAVLGLFQQGRTELA
jgi:flagellin